MSGLLPKFYELYKLILNALSQIDVSNNKEKTMVEVGNSYLSRIDQFKQELDQTIKDSVKEKFFYVMIGSYDWIMIQHLSKNFGISSTFFDSNSLEVRCYNSARFGDKFFIDVKEVIEKSPDQKELLKIYLHVLRILFYRKNRAADEIEKKLVQGIYGNLDYQKSDPFSCERVINHNGGVFNINRTVASIIFMSLTYILSSSLIWVRSTSPLREKISLFELTKI